MARSRSRCKQWPCHGCSSRSNLQPGLDLDLSCGCGSRSNMQPGLDLDLSHGCGSRSNAVALAVDLISSQV